MLQLYRRVLKERTRSKYRYTVSNEDTKQAIRAGIFISFSYGIRKIDLAYAEFSGEYLTRRMV